MNTPGWIGGLLSAALLPLTAAAWAQESRIWDGERDAIKPTVGIRRRNVPAADSGQLRNNHEAKVYLLTRVWLFNTSQPARSTLTVQSPQDQFAAPADATNGFTVKLTVDLKKPDGGKSILEIPNVLNVRLRRHDPLDRTRQNYPAFKMPDGSVP
ncbi:MAG: hypothetical protein JSU94_09940, partial [Phycisphaerales bacterium]